MQPDPEQMGRATNGTDGVMIPLVGGRNACILLRTQSKRAKHRGHMQVLAGHLTPLQRVTPWWHLQKAGREDDQ